jgi:hypothetical protein
MLHLEEAEYCPGRRGVDNLVVRQRGTRKETVGACSQRLLCTYFDERGVGSLGIRRAAALVLTSSPLCLNGSLSHVVILDCRTTQGWVDSWDGGAVGLGAVGRAKTLKLLQGKPSKSVVETGGIVYRGSNRIIHSFAPVLNRNYYVDVVAL